MSTLGLARSRTDLDWNHRGDAHAWELLAEVLDGKLDVQTLCERQRMGLDEVQGWLRERHRSALMAFDDQLKRALIRQGASPEAWVGPELSMSLADVSIIDWIQAIQIFAKQAVITVLNDEGESRIWYSDGAVVDAISGRLSGEAAAYRIVALEHGQVVTELRPVHRERTIRTSTAWLLLEAVRRKDESAQLRSKIGDLDRYFQCSEGGALNRSLNSAEAALLRLFDEPRCLAEMLAQSEIGDIETLAALDGLIRSGLLVETCPASQKRLKAQGSPAEPGASSGAHQIAPIVFAWPHEPSPQRGQWRWVLSTLLMGVFVSSAAWLGTQAPTVSTPLAALAPPVASESIVAYSVAVRTHPLDADLQIDGRAVGQGSWMARLPRDGVAHELRVSAPGFVPARIVFMDTPPPTEVLLDPLPAAPVAPVAETSAVKPGAPSTSDLAGEIAAAPLPKSTPPRKKRPATAGAKSPLPPSTSAATPARSRPRVQIIDEAESRAQPD